jgi:23S rRNA (uracil1939-C5)-methyltransferase
MKKWHILKNIKIEKLVFWWKWFAKLKSDNKDIDWKTIFVTWWCIPNSIVNLRVLKNKKNFIETQITETIKKSPVEKKHPTNKYWMSWGWRWINIDYDEQLKIKENQVKESFFHLQKLQKNINFEKITPSPIIDWYRNKVEFSFWKYISARYDREEHFNLWFHKQWEFSKIEDFEGCPLIDEFQNKIFREIKEFTKKSWFPVYDNMRQKWFFRHLVIRKTHFTNEMMIILWFNDKDDEKISKKAISSFSQSPHPNPLPRGEGGEQKEQNKREQNEKGIEQDESKIKEEIVNESNNIEYRIEKIKDFFVNLVKKYSEIKSVYLSHNSNLWDVAIGDLELIYWNEFITEKLHWLKFNISPKSFFQTNSSWAEKLYSKVLDFIKSDIKNIEILDLYAWTGTIWMIFAKMWAKKVYSVELVESASKNWKENALLNWLKNIEFICAKVENFLKNFWKRDIDLLVIDPPRVWMHPDALSNILKFKSHQIIYVSCNPGTLTRDLEYILNNSEYRIEKVWIMDMFPHTSHIESVVSMVRG